MGRPTMTPEQREASLLRRFHAGHEKGEPDECWEWCGPLMANGYGSLGTGRTGVVTVHRLALTLAAGPAPSAEAFACHTCDNRRCVNPAHLYWGDIRTNNADIRARGNKLTAACRRGHVRRPENTYVRIDRRGYTERHCKDCDTERRLARNPTPKSKTEVGRLGAAARWKEKAE